MGFLYTTDDTSRREDLLSILKDVSPVTDNYMVTNLGTSTAFNTLHQWLVDNIARPTSTNFVAEGSDPTYPNGSQPTRSENITAIITRPVQVTGTEQAVRVGLPGNPMDYQKSKALKQLKADMEFAIWNGTTNSGASGTARGMVGITGVISTNATARSSGTSMSTTELEDMLQDVWTQVGAGEMADHIFCPMGIKRKIAGFTTRVTPYVNSGDRVYANIAVYESSSGPVKIVPHKDVLNSGGTTHVFALNMSTFKMAFLKGREPQWESYAKTGDADKGQYLCELTLESLAQRANARRSGYALAG